MNQYYLAVFGAFRRAGDGEPLTLPELIIACKDFVRDYDNGDFAFAMIKMLGDGDVFISKHGLYALDLETIEYLDMELSA